MDYDFKEIEKQLKNRHNLYLAGFELPEEVDTVDIFVNNYIFTICKF